MRFVMYKFDVLVVYGLDSNELIFASISPQCLPSIGFTPLYLYLSLPRMFGSPAYIGAKHHRPAPPIVREFRHSY